MNMMIGGAIAFVILGVVLGLGAIILTQFQNSSSVGGSGTTAYTVIGNGLTALSTFSSWQNLLAIVIVAVIILTLVIRSIGGAGDGYIGGE